MVQVLDLCVSEQYTWSYSEFTIKKSSAQNRNEMHSIAK